MTDRLTYELLALDPTEETKCEDAPSLLHLLCGFSGLWNKPIIDDETFEIKDGLTILNVGQVQQPPKEELTSEISFGRAFIVTLWGSFDSIEPQREPLTGFLKEQKFEKLYVLKDEVSEHIACQLYPYLYRIENQLRSYLIKFMTTKVGPTWWEMTVSDEITEKVRMRKKNERIFGKHVENSAYLIDFAELGEIIYQQSSGFVTKEDILKRINDLEETVEAIKSFKKNLQTNYQKLFKESFADKNFKEKWKEFEILRNKIAHGNLFTADDLKRGKQLGKEIIELITTADQKTKDLVITEKEREAIQESVAERIYDWQKEITEEEFMRQLANQEERFSKQFGENSFVGVSLFLRHLTNLGYMYHPAKKMIDRLHNQEKIAIHKVPNPESDHETTAIKTIPQKDPTFIVN